MTSRRSPPGDDLVPLVGLDFAVDVLDGLGVREEGGVSAGAPREADASVDELQRQEVALSHRTQSVT